MTIAAPARRIRFAQLTRELLSASQRLQTILTDLQPPNPERAALIASQIYKITSQLSRMQAFILFEEEYVAFCDLIICGSEMATYLAARQTTKKSLRKHAHYWQKLTQTFKPFLKEALSNPGA